MKNFYLLFVLICLFSCASIFGIKTAPVPKALKDILLNQSTQNSAFRALIDGKITYKSQSNRIRLISICDNSERYRFELLAQGTSIPIAFIVGRDGQFTYYNTFDRERVEAPSSEDLFKKLLGVKIAAADLCTALAGKFQKKDIPHLGLILSDFSNQTELLHQERKTIYQIGMLGLIIEKLSFRDRNLKVNLHYRNLQDNHPWPSHISIFSNQLKGEFSVRSERVETFRDDLFNVS